MEILLSLTLLGESSEAAQYRIKKELVESSFKIAKEFIRDYIIRVKALMMKLEQVSVSTTKKESNRRILNSLSFVFYVEKNV